MLLQKSFVSCFLSILLLVVLPSLAFAQAASAKNATRSDSEKTTKTTSAASIPKCIQSNTITADVVALEQSYIYNRFGSFNPNGLIYALRRDVVDQKTDQPIGSGGIPGAVRLRSNKRPRPLILRVNEGNCLKVKFTNLLSPTRPFGQELVDDPETGEKIFVEREAPATRHVSMHVNGLDYVDSISSDGANVGQNKSSLVAPGDSTTYLWYARKQGGYFFYSMGAPIGGEGDGGQLGLGLFGSINVEPPDSKWYRSQVTNEQLADVSKNITKDEAPEIEYEKADSSGTPILNILKGKEIVHSDLNAIIVPAKFVKRNGKLGPAADCSKMGPGSTCGQPFREFSVIFHDEITAVQAFEQMEEAELKDGMAINYGAAGLGSVLLANREGKGPAGKCAECKLEEFFLTSWANGDPALIVKRENGKAVSNEYPDDPSNVHHSYLGDPVRFINIHAGPKETHVFHLHAHQWVQDKNDPGSAYLDSQTISPGTSFSYDIHYGGAGNRNLTPGDSIFHCHLYPHFAQGMWELWRTHDVFEDGSKGRSLPDGEIEGGTSNPALVPLPDTPLPPLPSEKFKGYPFYIAGQAGHRPPQPPLDLAVENGDELNGGLPRHRIISHLPDQSQPTNAKTAQVKDGEEAVSDEFIEPKTGQESTADCEKIKDLYERGKCYNVLNAQRVSTQSNDDDLFKFARTLEKITIETLPASGTDEEKMAMKVHAGEVDPFSLRKGIEPHIEAYLSSHGWDGKSFKSKNSTYTDKSKNSNTANGAYSTKPKYFAVNGLSPKPGAPFANPCPAGTVERRYRAAYVQFDLTVNKSGWHDPQARVAVLENDIKDTFNNSRPAEPLFFRAKSNECVVFWATNLVPSNLNLDDFQVFSGTDIIGQHIHLVKFDVTSSDGSGNGYNYEDGTYSPDEVRERILAHNRANPTNPLMLKTHSMFNAGGSMAGDTRGICPPRANYKTDAEYEKDLNENHPWCGAQTTVQRWWADPLMNNKKQDRTLRTVFTHDHFGPSSHQHHGLYAALVIEPWDADWQQVDGRRFERQDKTVVDDGGPTSYAANVKFANHPEDNKREYNLAFADFAIVYDEEHKPVNPTNRREILLPTAIGFRTTPEPEQISASDPGTQLINYRNEPIPLRIRDKATGKQKPGAAGDMANVFSSITHKDSVKPKMGPDGKPLLRFHDCSDPTIKNCAEPAGIRKPGDPATPLLAAYECDKVQVRLIQGAQEEQHVFSMNGVKWYSQAGSKRSGYVNAQQIGISEHFEFDVRLNGDRKKATDYLYRSTATDNLWDGMWGIGRVVPEEPEEAIGEYKHGGLMPIYPYTYPNPAPADACPAEGAFTRNFFVRAYYAKDILKDKALVYKRDPYLKDDPNAISDPNAIVFVKACEYRLKPGEDEERNTQAEACRILFETKSRSKLEKDLVAGLRKPEPLVLRAQAGECIKVRLENKLDESVNDGKADQTGSSWSWNMVPPIVTGFNFNQVEMSRQVGLHSQLVSTLVGFGDGSNVGCNNANGKDCLTEDAAKSGKSLVAPGKNTLYTWYAGDRTECSPYAKDKNCLGELNKRLDALKGSDEDREKAAQKLMREGWTIHRPIEFGATSLTSMGDVIKHSSHGAIGALIIEPEGATWKTDADMDAAATVTSKDKKTSFREFVVLYQDDLSLRQGGEALFNLRNGDDAEDSGQKAFNYRTEPIWGRLGVGPGVEPNAMLDYKLDNAFSSKVRNAFCASPDLKKKPCDPMTPIFKAKAGDDVRFRVLHPAGHPRQHGFTVYGHNWYSTPWNEDSTKQEANPDSQNLVGSAGGIGPGKHLNLLMKAGGQFAVPGDYMYRSQEGFQFGGGLWGIFRVEPRSKTGRTNATQTRGKQTAR